MKMPDQEKTWDEISGAWNYTKKPIKVVLDFLGDKKGKILDLGCGSGRHFLNNKKQDFYGVDFSKRMLEFAGNRGYNQLIKAEAFNLPFSDSFFDSAIYIATLHCIPDAEKREKSLQELRRVLKVKSRALISVWNREQPKFKDMKKEAQIEWGMIVNGIEKKIMRYYYLYDKKELIKLLEKYFKIIKIYEPLNSENNKHEKIDRRFLRNNIVVEIEKI